MAFEIARASKLFDVYIEVRTVNLNITKHVHILKQRAL